MQSPTPVKYIDPLSPSTGPQWIDGLFHCWTYIMSLEVHTYSEDVIPETFIRVPMAKAVIQDSEGKIEYIEPQNVWFPNNNNQEKNGTN